MDASGEGTSRSVRRNHEYIKGPARRRLGRTQKVKSVPHLIKQLRETVFTDPDKHKTKHQVLHQTKNYIQELENTLEGLLKMRDHIHSEERIPCSLEEVKEDYLRIYCCELSMPPETFTLVYKGTICTQGTHDLGSPKLFSGLPNINSVQNLRLSSVHLRQITSGIEVRSESEPAVWCFQQRHEQNLQETAEEAKTKLGQSPGFSAPGLKEFERYLSFYKQTVDMLVENGVVIMENVTHPVVSKAICNLWQELSQKGRADLYYHCQQQECSTACFVSCPKEPSCGYSCIRDSGTESQEASGSLVSSTPEEILFEDAFDLAASILDHSTAQNTTSPSSTYECSSWGSPENDSQLYDQITSFLRSHFHADNKVMYNV
ncbi:stimulated by retinoic acid gene 8 protein homolog [Pelobates fuscus]|uniref:stimulated by retinoic acid gene 8 protein homolog n=1 Tax=Pelobates fuscus TaxID=191477 RepID=UPI002FE44468